MSVLTAMGTVLGFWIVIFAACQGFGILTERLVQRGTSVNLEISSHFWTGFVVLLALLQVWHIFWPIDWRATIFFLGTGTAASLLPRRQGRFKAVAASWPYIILLGLWVANRGLDFARNYDSGLYHFATIRWINEYPLVPGLANLHERLGFNQSYFLFVALINTYPAFNEGYHCTSSLLHFVLAAQLLHTTVSVLRNSGTAPISDILQCLLLPVVVLQAVSENISSPSPDFAVLICGIALFVHLISWLENRLPEFKTDPSFFVVIALAVGGCTLKLSFAAFGLTIVAIVLLLCRNGHSGWPPMRRCALAWVAAAITLLGGVYAVRGIVLSGYPAFPIVHFSVPVDWRVPRADTENTANWIYSWARTPGLHWRQVLGSWSWLGPWWSRFIAVPQIRFSLGLSCTAMVLLAISLVLRSGRLGWRWLPFIPLVAGIASWFIAAPDPRFGDWLLWLVTAWTFSCIIWLNPNMATTSIGRPVALAMISVSALAVAIQPAVWQGFNGYGYAPLPRVPIRTFTTDSGLEVFLPPKGEEVRLWDAPLPATPLEKPSLELRGSTLRDGFRIAPDGASSPAKSR